MSTPVSTNRPMLTTPTSAAFYAVCHSMRMSERNGTPSRASERPLIGDQNEAHCSGERPSNEEANDITVVDGKRVVTVTLN